MAAQARALRIALVQLAVGADKATNLSRASEKVREATENGANIVVLPVSDYLQQYNYAIWLATNYKHRLMLFSVNRLF